MTASEKMAGALRKLMDAWDNYRNEHDLLGGGDIRTGRAWAKTTHARHKAEQALTAYENSGMIEVDRERLMGMLKTAVDKERYDPFHDPLNEWTVEQRLAYLRREETP
jgi:hypothetical protein